MTTCQPLSRQLQHNPQPQGRTLPPARDLPGPRTPRRAGDRALLPRPRRSNRPNRHRPPHPRPRPRRRANARGRRKRLPAPALPHAPPAGGLHALRPALGRGRPGLGDAEPDGEFPPLGRHPRDVAGHPRAPPVLPPAHGLARPGGGPFRLHHRGAGLPGKCECHINRRGTQYSCLPHQN